MWQSLQKGEALTILTAKSVASGLAPPFVGKLAYQLCRQYVQDIIVVPEESIGRAVIQLYRQGLVVEPSGAVGYAALARGLVPDVDGRKVVVVVSGGNMSVDELADIVQQTGAAWTEMLISHTTLSTRNVGTPKGRPTWRPPPTSSVRSPAMKKNAEFSEGGWKLRSYFSR